MENPEEIFNTFRNESILNEERAKSTQGRLDYIDLAIKKLETAKKRITEAFKAEAMTLQEFRKEKTDIELIELSEEKLISGRDGLMNRLNIQHNIEAKIDLFKETCHKFLSKINDPKIVTERLKKDIIKLVIDEAVINGEKLNISVTIPLPNKIHEREIIKTDLPDTFNAGATLGPINQTKMERIWTKHKQLNTTLKPKVFVAMSGGVDSSVAAALLQERGFDVHGVHIKMWSDPEIPCQFKDDRRDALRVADKLHIPFATWDLTEEYRTEVVNYMIREYAAGRTPNPDVMCNRKIKFGIFLKKALERGADFIATGHYVRLLPKFPIFNFQFPNKSKEGLENLNIENSLKIENYKLKIAKDLNKDQSYFLWTLSQEQLRHCLFPIGEYTKPHVRDLAKKFGLPTAEKPDSQGICFIGEIDLNNYLKKYIPETHGRMLTTAGQDIGEHDGLAFYTIGQREGLKAGGGIPYYVAKKDFQTNTLVVALGPFDTQLYSRTLMAHDVHWIAGIEPTLPLTCSARIRYRQPMQHATIEQEAEDGKIVVRFNELQRAITPGQSIVFYQKDQMLGGACIS